MSPIVIFHKESEKHVQAFVEDDTKSQSLA